MENDRENNIMYSGENLFKDILEFKKINDINGYSLFQLVLLFCNENNYEEEEIGALLKKDKSFRNLLEEDLKLNNEAQFKTIDDNKNMDWF